MKDKCINAAFICFYLPVCTVIVSYLLSIHFELVSKCIPNLEGCTSISRVGRYEPVKYFFKPIMYLFGVFLIFYWRENYLKLKLLIKDNNQIIATYVIGIISVIFFFLYIFF